MGTWGRTALEAVSQGNISPLVFSLDNVSSMREKPSTCETPLPLTTHGKATARHGAVPPKKLMRRTACGRIGTHPDMRPQHRLRTSCVACTSQAYRGYTPWNR